MIPYNLTKSASAGVFLLLFLFVGQNLSAQSEGYNKTIQLDNFKAINTTINENCFNKIGREFFLLEIDIQDSKFFPPSMQLSQSVFKTREILAIEELEVEQFYYLLNHDYVYTGTVVSYNLEDYIFAATKRHGDGVIKPGQTLQLYTANIENEYFTNIERLPFCHKGSNYCHASIRSNGNLMIFASDMPGGHGGYDLYGAARVDGVWPKPYNLGPKINSLDDELYPFFSEDGYLYFSSDKFGGAGETDIYVSERLDDGWSAAANLGAPYNSKSHDYGFRLLNYKGYGTLSSDRSGGIGIDDIYTFRHFREEENKNLIEGLEDNQETVSETSTEGNNTTNNITNNYFNFQSADAAGVMDKEAYVIFYQGNSDYNDSEFNADKEGYVKLLPVVTAKKYQVKDLANIAPEKDQFVQIKIKGYNDVYLTPHQATQKPFNFDFVEKGWKHLPGQVIFSNGVPVDDVRVDLTSLDGYSKVTAKTDEHGKFVSRVMTDQNYEVRILSNGLQLLETFEFDPENFDQLIIDLTMSQAFYRKILDAINNIPTINENTADVDLQIEEPVVVHVKEEPEAIPYTIIEEAEPEAIPDIIEEEPVVEWSDDDNKDRYTGDETGNFFVIAGTFSAEYRAVRRIELLASKGFTNAKLIKVKGKPYFKVMIQEYQKLLPAIDKEKAVYDAIEDCYILRKEPAEIEISLIEEGRPDHLQ